MKCPQCKSELQPVTYDVGRGVSIKSRRCGTCRFNLTDEGRLQGAIAQWREHVAKEVKVVAVGEGLGVRFPKEVVEEFGIRKGARVKVRPGKGMIEMVF